VGVCLILKKTTSDFLYYVAFVFAICVVIFSMANLIDGAEKMAGWVVWILIVSVLYDMLWQKNHK
jgi:UDP-N-acetylmuramyl pentapeptide phosphotransferase/UDP-N-acetylglucosamine-1-phosphate transferase